MLAGRDGLLQAVFEDLAGGPGRARYHHVFYGARGVGKTVLLSEIADHVRREWGWAVVDYSGTPEYGPRHALAEAAPRLLRELGGRRAASQRLSRQVEAAPPLPGRPLKASVTLPGLDASQFLPVLQRLGELARKRKAGVLFLVDEVQRARARPDLELLGNTVQQLERREELPVSFAIAGLHTTPRHLAQACTFFERQDKVEVGDLSPDATRVAYLEPLAASGVRIDSDALALLVSQSDGYPFAIQLYGRQAWDQAGAGGHITIDRAARAIEEADRWLAVNLYEPRWERLDTLEQAIVKAIAALGGDMVATGDIAAAVGRRASQLSVARDALLNEHHLVHSPRYGHLAFDLPGFDRWLRANEDLTHLRLPPPGPPGRRSTTSR
ncbi:MAG TPA: ATP-binding protein [Acidimicrobiia bacterium]|nr:ATP-binding protein [Acidimicrobiia bacterium]